MKIAKVHITGTSIYSASRPHKTEMYENESHEAYDQRTWREKLHYDDNGDVFVDGIAFQFSLIEAAGLLGEKVPGTRGKMFKGLFEKGGIMVPGRVYLGVKKDDFYYADYYVNADGRRGSGKRVWRRFPEIKKWGGIIEINVMNDMISKEVLERHLDACSRFLGIGRYRAGVGGSNGAYSVTKVEWEELMAPRVRSAVDDTASKKRQLEPA